MDLCEFWKNNTQGPYKYIYLADSIKVALDIENVCLDFIQGACTESLDGQVQGTTTDPSHEFIDNVILVVTLYYFIDVFSST